MPIPHADFELTTEELRAVTRFAAECAQDALRIFEEAHPDDPRPRAALEAAWAFANGDPRSIRQRRAAFEAHRAAKDASTEASRYAAGAAGDAAAAAYLHPLAKATQVGHIVRAAANAARAFEVQSSNDPEVGKAKIEQARARATPVVMDVLGRYPLAPVGKSRVSQLMVALDRSLRVPREENEPADIESSS